MTFDVMPTTKALCGSVNDVVLPETGVRWKVQPPIEKAELVFSVTELVRKSHITRLLQFPQLNPKVAHKAKFDQCEETRSLRKVCRACSATQAAVRESPMAMAYNSLEKAVGRRRTLKFCSGHQNLRILTLVSPLSTLNLERLL